VGVWAVKFYYPGLLLFQLKYSLFHFMVLEWKCLVTNLLCPYCIFFVTRVQPDLSKGKKKKNKEVFMPFACSKKKRRLE
jgi:hypothetical protein